NDAQCFPGIATDPLDRGPYEATYDRIGEIVPIVVAANATSGPKPENSVLHYLELAAVHYAAAGQYSYDTPHKAKAAHLSSTKRATAFAIVCAITDVFLNAMGNIGINRGHAEQIAARKKAISDHNSTQAALHRFRAQHHKDTRIQHGNAKISKDDPPTAAPPTQPSIRHHFRPQQLTSPETQHNNATLTKSEPPTTAPPTQPSQPPQPALTSKPQPHAWTLPPSLIAQSRVHEALQHAQDGDTAFDIDGTNPITAGDLRKLTNNGAWITDSIINPTLALLTATHPQIQALTSQFLHTGEIQRTAFIAKHKHSLRKASTLLIPSFINDSHWALSIINLLTGALTYIDGLNQSPPAAHLEILANSLTPILGTNKMSLSPSNHITQSDTVSCGPLLLTAAAQWIAGDRPYPLQRDMPNARINIAAFLLAAQDEALPRTPLTKISKTKRPGTSVRTFSRNGRTRTLSSHKTFTVQEKDEATERNQTCVTNDENGDKLNLRTDDLFLTRPTPPPPKPKNPLLEHRGFAILPPNKQRVTTPASIWNLARTGAKTEKTKKKRRRTVKITTPAEPTQPAPTRTDTPPTTTARPLAPHNPQHKRAPPRPHGTLTPTNRQARTPSSGSTSLRQSNFPRHPRMT
ncbi:hypothetical protein TrLO_g13163, partial [Triparma laevis f. longispina]